MGFSDFRHWQLWPRKPALAHSEWVFRHQALPTMSPIPGLAHSEWLCVCPRSKGMRRAKTWVCVCVCTSHIYISSGVCNCVCTKNVTPGGSRWGQNLFFTISNGIFLHTHTHTSNTKVFLRILRAKMQFLFLGSKGTQNTRVFDVVIFKGSGTPDTRFHPS